MFGSSLQSLNRAALLHLPGRYDVRDVIILRKELRPFLLCALYLSGSVDLFLSQCFSSLFIINSFSPITEDKALAQEEFCSMSQKISYLSAAWLHLRKVILWSSTLKTNNALSPDLQNLTSRHCHGSFQLEYSSDTYPASLILPQQSVLQKIWANTIYFCWSCCCHHLQCSK